MKSRTCPECGTENLYHTMTDSGGRHGPMLLPKLGPSFWWPIAKFHVVLCGDCGFTRFFAEEAARKKLPQVKEWVRI